MPGSGRDTAALLVSAVAIAACWVYGWAEPIRTASTAGEPTGDTPFILAHCATCLLVGYLIPRLARLTGPIVLAPAILWIVVHVFTYDGSQGASFWPLALIMILVSMPLLSIFGMLGRWLRKRIARNG
jgi:hypothetical protein